MRRVIVTFYCEEKEPGRWACAIEKTGLIALPESLKHRIVEILEAERCPLRSPAGGASPSPCNGR